MQTKIISAALIIVGITLIASTKFSYVTAQKVVNISTLTLDKANNQPVGWTPIVGVLLLIAGGVVIVLDLKKKT